MGQTTLILMIITVISKIFGFVRESVMAAYIGAGELKSVYTTATTIPVLITGIVVSGIKSAYIPTFNKVKNEKGLEEANNFTSNLINILIVYGAISVIIVIIFAKPLTYLLSPDLSGNSLELAVRFTRILSVSILVSLTSSIFSGYFNINGNFIDPAIVGFIYNLFVIFSIILSAIYNNPLILIVGTLVGSILQCIRYPFVCRELGYKHKSKFSLNDPYIKYLIVIIIPIVFSSAANQLAVLVDNSMASAFFGASSISKMFYARTMLNFITGVFTLSISTVTFPEIAKLGQYEDTNIMRNYLSSALVNAMLLVIPATFGMMTLSTPIIKVAFERNAFLSSDTVVVSELLVAYGPSIIFSSFIQIITNVFYSVGDSKTTVKISLIQQIINVILNIILSRIYGLMGLALATTASSILGFIFLFFYLNKKIGKSNSNTSSLSIFKILISSAIMSLFAIGLYGYFISLYNVYISLFFSVAIAGLIYFFIIINIKIPEVNVLRVNIIDKLRKK